VARAALVFGLLTVAAAACSSGGSSGSPATHVSIATTTTAGLPAAVDPGEAVVVLAGRPITFTVDGCGLPTGTTDAPGVQTTYELRGSAPGGDTLVVTRQETQGAGPTTTDTVTVVDRGRVMEAQRARFNGNTIDLRDPTATTPLLTINDGSVRGSGRFGPPDAPDHSADVDGAVAGRCP
jgi:hypothetical protein